MDTFIAKIREKRRRKGENKKKNCSDEFLPDSE